MKVTSINYFDRAVDGSALAAFKETAEYKAAVGRSKKEGNFSLYQNEVETRFTNLVSTSEGNVDIDIDYISLDEYGINVYTSDSHGLPVILFKFENAKPGVGDRELTPAEKELLEAIVSEYELTDIEL